MDMTMIAFAIGAVLSLILQLLKRWYTFTPEAIKGFVIILAIVYSVGASIYANTFDIWNFVFNLGAFITSNQGFFALILNNTNTGDKLAGVTNIPWDK